MAKASSSVHCETKRIQRVLFVGPTGVGKSTLINSLINHSMTAGALSRPARVGDTAHGLTSAFVTYYDLPNHAYTDSVGLGDNRFQPEDVMKSLQSVLKNSAVGYNKVYICIQYGRISSDTRRYIDLIATIFGDRVLKWCSIIFTRCNDQTMTKEKYLSKNSNDTDIIEMINQVTTVIFGDNMIDDDPEMEIVLQRRREGFLSRIEQDLVRTANQEYFKLKSKNMIERIRRIIRLFFCPFEKAYSVANDIKNFARAAAISMESSNYSNYFGECPICMNDMTDDNQPVITLCNHVYHRVCLEEWFLKANGEHCPLCRTKLDDSGNQLYTILTINV